MRDLDSTRVISAGCNGVSPDNNLFVSGALDVYGFNYHSGFYDKTREWFPDKPLFGSETASAINSRGIYHQPSTKLEVLPGWFGFKETAPLPEDFQLTAYDMCRVFAFIFYSAQFIIIMDKPFNTTTHFFVFIKFQLINLSLSANQTIIIIVTSITIAIGKSNL